MKVFSLFRKGDVTGVSGTGMVATVVQFDTGKCAVAWEVDGRPQSIAIYDELEDVRLIHLHGGLSELLLIWDSEEGHEDQSCATS